MTVTSTDLVVIPGSGEVARLDDLTEVASALRRVKELESELREAKGILQDAVRYHSEREGARTLHVEGVGKFEVKGGTETTYLAEEIEKGLREAGMPEERIRQIVVEQVTYTVKAVEAKKAAAANPAYAEVIERHKVVTEKRGTVSGP